VKDFMHSITVWGVGVHIVLASGKQREWARPG
jgi:hypothetical protein